MALAVVGKPIERVDAPAKVSGSAVYTADVTLPNMLYGKCLRSPHPHARILRIDTSKARALPGVVDVITAADIPDRLIGLRLKDMPMLAKDRVMFVGEKIAVVAAEDEDIADEAVDLIEVEYEPLPPLIDMLEAMKPGAPLLHPNLHDYEGLPAKLDIPNCFAYWTFGTGDIEQGFKEADQTFEEAFTTQMMHQAYLETHGTVVNVEPSGRITVYCSTKAPFRMKKDFAECVGVPEEQVRFITGAIGGDFGGKGYVKDEPLAYFLAKRTGRAVKMIMSREEEFLTGNPRHASHITIRTGVKNDGRLVALQARLIFDSGAYGGYKPNITLDGPSRVGGAYRIPHAKIECYMIYTNHVPCGHLRSPGEPQSVFASESNIDIIAHKMGIDPYTFRKINIIKPGDVAVNSQRWESIMGIETLEAAIKASNWGKPKASPNRGLGIALSVRRVGVGRSGAIVEIEPDGTLNLITGVSDQGTGVATLVLQVAAEEMGVPLERCRVTIGTTDEAKHDDGSGGSRVTHVAGQATRLAVQEARRQLAQVAAMMFECPPDQVEALGPDFGIKGRPDMRLSMAEVAAEAARRLGHPVRAETEYVSPPISIVCFAAHVAEVEVDPETGKVYVIRYVAAHDVGRAINVASTLGQIQGGIVQGLGFALTEDFARANGRPLTLGLADYKIFTAGEVPEIVPVLIEGGEGPGPYGAKSVGEPPHSPVAGAIANAVFDAVGARVRDLPITGEKVLRAMRAGAG